ncbi:mitochondrial intermembrane space import and assembly protein 40 [Pyricularia oryzae 70-15]|uniref:Mitochondrial intermembrane space import and assembly protein 40 n=4 Tax=Pyricularia oryzae TaxID=318829 RepID=G4NI50_PYRO7|nr:mitochondrial intermembrane space import and assembly protein 40 [Pyricularia oryzae 70-15]EHA47910.1 mitochondrial intermembrane space import and assembly protein 40 [Pyricularia oryzae 70-15]KAI7916365.1 mitochondrial intermembrane space import and assembly protein 40 [Pyricularia oryzae]KAI7922072.1 mitochondrial intermembrane space import and assembly protein 40 [Pyricularia oryzae]
MYRAAIRTTTRAARSAPLSNPSRRYLSSTPADKPRTWKGAAVRWGLAFGALYWYNTSPIFADEPIPQTIAAPPKFRDAELPTVESVIEQKRKEAEARAAKAVAAPAAPSEKPQDPTPEASAVEAVPAKGEAAPASGAMPGSPEALEEEAGQQGAFNPETGEINWDCPCLGGMADGPCGEEFKAAFSCFVYSTEEPKGMDCIEKFQGMQDCFKKYPEVYGAELADAEATGEDDADALPLPESSSDAPVAEKATEVKDSQTALDLSVPEPKVDAAVVPKVKETPAKTIPESEVIPKKAVDATDANEKAKEQ